MSLLRYGDKVLEWSGGYFDWEKKAYQKIPVNEQVEVLSMIGDVAQEKGKPKVHVHVVVPTGPHGTDGAADRLAAQLECLRALGCMADGEVVSSRPVAAVRHALRREAYDQIILSTLPAGASAWLRMDAGARIERLSRLPVTHVVAADAPPDGPPPDGNGVKAQGTT